MSRITMQIWIKNESNANLMYLKDEVIHGSYTSGWNPPSIIEAGTTKGFQAEGNVMDVFLGQIPVTGTEGRIHYAIQGEGGELYIHWNSPLIESQYANTFHIWGPPNWEVSHKGGQSGQAILEIRLRRTERRSVPNFNPRVNGFPFSNSWVSGLPVVSIGYIWNRLFDTLPGPLSTLQIQRLFDENTGSFTEAKHGMCGGMVFAAMDYFHHGFHPPNHATSPTTADDPLFKFIRDRLIDSFDITGQGHRFLGYSSPHYPNGDEGVLQNILGLTRGRSWITYREEWPRIQADIDAGKLSPVGLIQTVNLSIGENHQVLAYAYQKSGQDVTLYIYDPNKPGQEIALKFNVTHTTGEVHIQRYLIDGYSEQALPGDRIFCFFRNNGYQLKSVP